MTATSTLPKADQKKIADFLKDRHIPVGLGTKAEACSIAAINLALTGTLSDTIPDCMSRVIGKWIIRVQDAMPDELRNSREWKRLLPLAAGTGRDFEEERRAIILDWMWGTVLPTLQPIADKRGYGAQWLAMTTGRTYDLAVVAKTYAYAASADAAYAALRRRRRRRLLRRLRLRRRRRRRRLRRRLRRLRRRRRRRLRRRLRRLLRRLRRRRLRRAKGRAKGRLGDLRSCGTAEAPGRAGTR
jgi:hypothetical protein